MVDQVLESEQRVVAPVVRQAFKGTIAFSVNKEEFEAARKAFPAVSKPQELGVVAKQLLLAKVAKVNELGGGVRNVGVEGEPASSATS